MKKIFLILMTLIAIFGISNVNAESCSSPYIQQLEGFGGSVSATNGKNTYIFDFNSNRSFGNYTYLKGQLWYSVVQSNTSTYTSNINLTESATSLQCSNYTSQAGNESYVGTIHYADGSSATIDWKTRTYICDTYTAIQNNISGTITNTIYNEPNVTGITMAITNTNNTNTYCDVDLNGNFTCALDSNSQYKRIIIMFTLSNVSNATIKYGMVTNWLRTCNSDTQQIINNNNQNTQTIVNNITDTTLDPTTLSNTTNINNLGQTSTSNGALNLLMLPVNFLSSIISSFGNTCASFDLGTLWGVNITLPCINLKGLLGQGLYNLIDIFMFFGIFFAFIKSVIKFIRKTILLTYDASSEVGLL